MLVSLNCENSVEIQIEQNKENMGDNDDIRPYDELFSSGTVSNTKYLSNGDMEGMEEKELKTKQIIDKLVDDYVACRITYDEFSKEMKSFYADEDESKPILKEFDLEAAKAGKPVCTRDGRKARIICFDRRDKFSHIVALITNPDGREIIWGYEDNGACSNDNKDNDLMMLPEKKEGWVNICRNLNTNKTELDTKDIYNTKEEALQNLSSMTYVTTVKIEWEE